MQHACVCVGGGCACMCVCVCNPKRPKNEMLSCWPPVLSSWTVCFHVSLRVRVKCRNKLQRDQPAIEKATKLHLFFLISKIQSMFNFVGLFQGTSVAIVRKFLTILCSNNSEKEEKIVMHLTTIVHGHRGLMYELQKPPRSLPGRAMQAQPFQSNQISTRHSWKLWPSPWRENVLSW